MRQKAQSTGTMYFGTIFEGEWWGRKKSYFKLRLCTVLKVNPLNDTCNNK